MAADKIESADMRVAEQLLRLLPGVTAEMFEDDQTIRIRLRKPGWKLASIVLWKSALAKLQKDPMRSVKIEYLGRDIRRVGASAVRYQFPRRLPV